MIKRITALLLSICLLLSAAPVYAGAAAGQRVSANAVTVTAGNTAYVTLTAENFENIAALDVYVYYDPSVFTVGGQYTGWILSDAQTSVNTSETGTVKLSAMALNGINGTGELMTIYFETNYNCTPGTYPISVAIGRAYDSNLSETAIKGVNGSVTVEKQVTTETFQFYNDASRYTLQKGDLLHYYVWKSWYYTFVSGEFVVEYDHELFAFESVELSPEMTQTGALYSVNSAVLGQVRIAYAGNEPVYNEDMFSVTLRVIADVDAQTSIATTTGNVYRGDLTAYLPGSASVSVQLNKMPQVIDHPDAFLNTEMLAEGRQSRSVFCLEAGAGIAAADFYVSYNPEVLRCVSVNVAKALEGTGAMVIINDNFSTGAVRFSYVNMQATQEALSLVEILWEPVGTPTAHILMGLGGRGVVDSEQTAVPLEYITANNCAYTARRTEPTCQKEGKVEYLCAECQDLQVQTIPVISEADCTHYTVLFLNEDGKELTQQVCHYGDEITLPADPVKTEDDVYTYTFAGWDKEVVPCVGNVTYTATYTPVKKPVVFVEVNGQQLHYGTLAEAVENAPAGSTLQLIKDNEENLIVTKELIVDLNGFDLTGNIVAQGAKLWIKDSKTDALAVTDYGKVTGNVSGVQAAEDYIMITEEDGVSFHRIDLALTDMTLRPSAVGVYYKSNFAGDEIVARNVARYGVALSIQGAPTADAPGVMSWFDDFQAGDSNAANGTLLHGIMKQTNSHEENAANAELLVYGRAYILTKDGQYAFGQTVSLSLRQQVELIDGMWNELTQTQQTAMRDMYETYQSVMEHWNIPNIKK